MKFRDALIRDYIAYLPYAPIMVMQTLFGGFIAGMILWLLTLGLKAYVLTPIFCGNNASFCSATPTIAYVIALLIAHFIGLVILIRIGTLRPLLVVLATILTLWNVYFWLAGTTWWVGMLFTGGLVGLSYLFFAWISRLSHTVVAVVMTIVLALLLRLLIG